MSEMAFGWTPYRFGFNNPVSVTDPLGLFESWDDARAFALISRMDNFSIERMGRYWSVWNYDLDATYSIVNGEFQVSRLLDLDITITGAGKPKTNPVPEGMRSFESLGGMPAAQGGGGDPSYITFAPEHTDVFEGFWGKTRYFLLGPNVGNARYDMNGNYQGPALIAGIAPTPGKFFRGGSKVIRDGYITRLPKEFQRWFHRVWKDPSAPNAANSEIDEAFELWRSIGKPHPK